MARCTGGPNQRGEDQASRMHLNGDENNCTKHRSDNFSFLSTISRVAARNAPLVPPLQVVPEVDDDNDDDDGDGIETERSMSLPSTIPDTIARSWSVDSIGGEAGSVRERSQSVEGIAAALQVQERRTSSFPIAAISVLTVILYGYYRWLYRVDFQYQDGVIREWYGLAAERASWW